MVTLTREEAAIVLDLAQFVWKAGAVKDEKDGLNLGALQGKLRAALEAKKTEAKS